MIMTGKRLKDSTNKQIKELTDRLGCRTPKSQFSEGELIRWRNSKEAFNFILNEEVDRDEYKAKRHWEKCQGKIYEVIVCSTLTLTDGSKCICYTCMDDTGLLEIIPESFAEFVF